MGKGPRGGAEKSIKAYEGPLWGANTTLARNAGNIMYGGDTSSPGNYRRTTGGGSAQPRTARNRGGTTRETTGPGFQDRPGGQGSGNFEADFNSLFPGDTISLGELQDKEAELAAMGMKLVMNASGTSADVQLPDGTFMDVGAGMGASGGKPVPKHWNVDAPSGRGGGGGQGYSGGPGGVAGDTMRNFGDIMSRYSQFADTGGYNPQTLDAIRSRALSPVRAAYSDANRSIDRSRSLQGDYAPGYAAQKAQMARQQGSAVADATTNTEGMLGQMVQRGRLAGMGGMASMFGTSPGMASTFGNQALQAQGLQNQTGMGLINARMNAQQMPGAFDTTVNRIGRLGGAIFPWT